MLTPPTDSLYKFLAVFGLVLLVTSFLMIGQAERSFNEAQASIMVENANVGSEQLAESRQVLELVNQLKNYPNDSPQQLKILEEIGKPGLHRSSADLELSESYVRAKKMYESVTAEYLRTAQEFALLLIAGIILTVSGFLLWYVKIQRFLDQQLVATASREHTVSRESSA